MTPEEIVARLLYRDGLMLVIDKPAGFAVHRGRRAARAWRIISTRCASGCRARPRWRTGSTAIPPVAWCSAATARRWPSSAACSRTAASARPTGRWWKAGPTEDEGRIDLPLGSNDATRGWWMKHDPQGQPAVTTWKVMGRDGTAHLAGARAAHRPHPSAARALRGHGLADRRRPIYGSAPRAAGRCLHLHCARDRGAALQEPRRRSRVRAPVPLHMHERLQACGWQGRSVQAGRLSAINRS